MRLGLLTGSCTAKEKRLRKAASVGAIRALWRPFFQQNQQQAAATIVLPLPTSPWTSRLPSG